MRFIFLSMKPFLLNDFGNASQPYSFARTAKVALKSARITIANCINANPEEIYFTSGGTESDNWAIKSPSLIDRDNGTTITSQIEHHAVLHAWQCYSAFYLVLNHPTFNQIKKRHGINYS